MKCTSPSGGYGKLVRQKQLRKALLLVLLSVSACKCIDTRLYFIITNFHREQTSVKRQPWYECSSIHTVENVWLNMNTLLWSDSTKNWSRIGSLAVTLIFIEGFLWLIHQKLQQPENFCWNFRNWGGNYPHCPPGYASALSNVYHLDTLPIVQGSGTFLAKGAMKPTYF